MKKYFYTTIFFCACILQYASAQDPHFSQFFQAPLLRNPSLAGIFAGDIRVQGVFRSQWGAVTVPYQTGSFNFEYKQPVGRGNDFLTLGMQVLYDKAGTIDYTTTNVLPALNYHKSLNGNKNKYLSMGFMGGWVGKSIDVSKITTNNQYDGNGYNPSLSNGEKIVNPRYNYLDGSVGMSFNSCIAGSEEDMYFVGIAFHHFNRPLNSFYQDPTIALNPKWVVSGGVKFGVGDNDVSYLTLEGDYTKQGSDNEIIAGGLYTYKIGADVDEPQYKVSFGAFLRWKDAIVPVVQIDMKPYIIAISYDVNVSQLITVSQARGGAEISLTYAGFLDRDNSTKNSMLCPKF
jgi:type IX secretion system PorP/SprF family membrane protein